MCYNINTICDALYIVLIDQILNKKDLCTENNYLTSYATNC